MKKLTREQKWRKLLSKAEWDAFNASHTEGPGTWPAWLTRYFFELLKRAPELIQIDPDNCRAVLRVPDNDMEEPETRLVVMHFSGDSLLTQEQAAEDAEIDYRSIQRWRKQGLETIGVDEKPYIPQHSLQKFVMEHKGGKDIYGLTQADLARLRRLALEMGLDV